MFEPQIVSDVPHQQLVEFENGQIYCNKASGHSSSNIQKYNLCLFVIINYNSNTKEKEIQVTFEEHNDTFEITGGTARLLIGEHRVNAELILKY